MKTVTILGTGVVGQKLAGGFKKYGYWVVMGAQTPEKPVEWGDKALSNTKVVSFLKAATEGDLVVVAIKGTAAESVVTSPRNYAVKAYLLSAVFKT